MSADTTETDELRVTVRELREAMTELQRKVFILEAFGNDQPRAMSEEPWAEAHAPDTKHIPADVWSRVRVLPDSARAGL